MKNWKKIDIKKNATDDGALCVIEGSSDIPFEIRRVFWISGVPAGVSRGNHAMKRTRMLLCAVSGSCEIVLKCCDAHEVVTLRDPAEGLLIEPHVWRSMCAFSRDCVLLVLCDRPYDVTDVCLCPPEE